jgi:hypothetical protein
MKTLFEIIESAKDGNMPTQEECYYAMLCLDAIGGIDHRQLQQELFAEKQAPEPIRKMKAKNSFDMWHNALNKSPKDYLGWNNDPANPEYQKIRKLALNIFDKIAKQAEKGG